MTHLHLQAIKLAAKLVDNLPGPEAEAFYRMRFDMIPKLPSIALVAWS